MVMLAYWREVGRSRMLKRANPHSAVAAELKPANPHSAVAAERKPANPHSAVADVKAAVGAVPDPEIPVVTIEDLGILRGVAVEGERVVVTITPTYSGCPAMDAIRRDIVEACADAGCPDVEVRTVLSPAWTTDWITGEGRRKLREYGIAPPASFALPASASAEQSTATPLAPPGRGARGPVLVQLSVRCPQCGSPNTREVSRFGSTACKALQVCNDCREPFDHFKAI
jgi:ring-1,2-phenylacetyl-CoA epoxidase subunit PaaD